MLYLGSDHNGFRAKEKLKKFLEENNIAFEDLGNDKNEPLDDYPDWGHKVAKKISTNPSDLGLLLCGSGQGMAMVANRYSGVRALLGYSLSTVKHGREDEDANVLALPVWSLSDKQIEEIVILWLHTPFSQGERHIRRIKKIDNA